MKSVLLVGGSGFIALNLIERFLSSDYYIYVYGLNKPSIKSENICFIQGNLDEIQLHSVFFKKLNIINAIYLVNTFSVNDDEFNYLENIDKNKKALHTLSKVVGRIVFFSSGGRVYTSSDKPHSEEEILNPLCMYGKSKVALETYLKSISELNNKQYLIVRPSNPYGKHQPTDGKQGFISVLVGRILKKQPVLIWGTGEEVRDYIYIDDFIDIFFKLFEKKSLSYKVYNIGSGKGTSSLNILHAARHVFGENEKIVYSITPTHKPLINKNILSNNRVLREVGDYKFKDVEMGVSLFLKELRIKD